MCREELDQKKLSEVYDKFAKLLAGTGDSLKRLTSYDSGVVFEFFSEDDIPKVWWISPEELAGVIGERSVNNGAKALVRFFTQDQLVAPDCDWEDAQDTLSKYIMMIVGQVYDLNGIRIVLEHDATFSLYLLFETTQALDASKLAAVKGRNGQKQPAFRFTEDYLRSLLGLTRKEISQTVFSWLPTATGNKEEKKQAMIELTTMEEFKENLSLDDFINSYQSGELESWLMRNGKTMMLKRLKSFQIPHDETISRKDVLHLCEVFFPDWDDLPSELKSALHKRNYLDVELSDEQCHQAFSQLARLCETKIQVQFTKNSNHTISDILLTFMDDDDQMVMMASVSSEEMAKLLASTSPDNLGEALYAFLAEQPLIEAGRDLRYVLIDIQDFIYDIASKDYNLANFTSINFGARTLQIMFKDEQPIDAPHMSLEKNKMGVFPCYSIDGKQVKKLCGLSRFDVADKVLHWLEKANLNKKEVEE